MNNQYQFDIFDQLNLFKTEYKNFLSDGKIPQAIESLKYLSASRPEFIETLESLMDLNTLISVQAGNLNNLFELYTTFDRDDSFSALKKDRNHIIKGLQKILSGSIKQDDYHFLDAVRHPSWFLLKTENYSQAIELLNKSLSTVGEHSLLRQYLAFSCSKTGNSKAARLHFTLAMFNNPVVCDADFIFARHHQKLFETLRSAGGDEGRAWVHFTFQLWLEDGLHLDYVAAHFREFLLSELSQRENNQEFRKNSVLFLNYLYIAESYRALNTNYRDMITIREKMKELDAVRFDTYLKKIAAA